MSSPDPGASGTLRFAVARLFREAQEVREPARGRIDVHRGGEDVLAPPEDRLRAVPVVRVDVQDRDARQAARAEVLGRDRRRC